MSERDPAHDERSVATILAGLSENAERLVRQQLALGLAELDRRADEAAARLKRAAIGGAVLFAGSLALLAAVILLLGQYLALWLASTIVGALVAPIGYALLRSATPSDAEASLPPHATASTHRNEARHELT